MKTQLKTVSTYFIVAMLVMAAAASCKKEVSTNNDIQSTIATTSTSATIAVAGDVSTSTNGTTADSVYIISPCDKGSHRDSIAASALPATVQNYLTSNYSGYTFNKVFAVKDTSGNVKGYVVIINYNGKPVGLEFKADGTFVKVLEQRERGDLNNNGWHVGGRFENRNGLHKDTVAFSSLPATLTGYISANYAGDTLIRAFKVTGGNYLIISKNNGLFATLFTNTGVFVARVSLTALSIPVTVSDATLPPAALSYLAATYPNYVLDKAVSVSVSGTLKGYIAVINANNTRYCIAFDANGNFVAVKTIW